MTKRFGAVVAVDGVDLAVERGETFVLLGSSGSGKTTLLRLIAGLEQPDAGRIVFGGRDFTGVPARRRGVGIVFQSYALFPHKRVFENVAYGLRARRVEERELGRRVTEALDLVGLGELGQRYPAELSGGQQQRVALARALVIRPAVLLLDEPFGALDFKLRRRMQLELRTLLAQVGTTAVHVTHDQEEALALADRLGVMHDGRIEQVGTGQEVYAAPTTAFVASFLGEANLLPVERSAHGVAVAVGGARVPLGETTGAGPLACLRPELLRLSDEPTAADLTGLVRSVVFLGDAVLCEVDCGGELLRIRVPAREGGGVAAGAEVGVHLPARIPLVAA